jgi:hypothetical protein
LEHSIGIQNEQGDTVLQPKPRSIQIDHPNLQEKVILHLHMGRAFTILHGTWKGTRVQPGDYVNDDGLYRAERWLLRCPKQWEKVG